METTNLLMNLAIAGLISEGEFDIFTEVETLHVPFNRKKQKYLEILVKENGFKDFVTINETRGQFTIHTHPVLKTLKKQWYEGHKKIFSKVLDPEIINLEAIVLAINLFGNRQLESISIRTTVEKESVKALSYCIEWYLKNPVIPGTKQIKISNVTNVVLSSISDIPAIHSAELMNTLTKNEKKRLLEGV